MRHQILNFSLIFLFSMNGWSRNPIPASRYQYLTGSKINQDPKTSWDQKFNKPQFIFGKKPAKFLADNYQFLSPESLVLDVGMGEGRNAVFLAQKGHKVTGVDISSIAVKKAQMLAKEYGVKIKGIVSSMQDYKIFPDSYDVIICFYYVDRSLVEKMKGWLRPGGIIIYEAHTLRQRQETTHKNDPAEYFLKEQELLKLFSGMKILKFEEPVHENEFRSSIIVQKQ